MGNGISRYLSYGASYIRKSREFWLWVRRCRGQEVGGKVRGAVRSGRGYLFQLVGLEEAEELLVGPGVAS
jgi:hypothetical protein